MPAAWDKRIAWDGVSFHIPRTWELALYKRIKRRIWRLEIEDEYSVRLEIEWTVRKKPLDVDTVLARYEKSTGKIAPKAVEKRPVESMPEHWNATYYTFSQTQKSRVGTGLEHVKHGLVTAFYIPPDKRFFCFALLHVYPENLDDNPSAQIRRFAKGFRRHGEELIPWQMFDVAFKLPRQFLLEGTSFGIGSKLMVFRWRTRRFYLWHLSCADKFLRPGVVPERWLAGFLNDFKRIRGIVFEPGPGGSITWHRRKRHPLGHRDEIARGCYKYEIRYLIDPRKNRVVLWVFNYQKPEDLETLPEAFLFDPRPGLAKL